MAVSTGGAYAANTIRSSDIVDNEVYSVDVRNDGLTGGGLAASDLRAGSVGTSEVALNSLGATDLAAASVGGSEAAGLTGADVSDGSLTGADINESSLSEVPSAAAGGIGRWIGNDDDCDPGSGFYFTCAFTTIDLPQRSKVLVIGTTRAHLESSPTDWGQGYCRVATSIDPQPTASTTYVQVNKHGDFHEHVTVQAIVGPYGPGPVDFAIACNQFEGDIAFFDSGVTALAISPN